MQNQRFGMIPTREVQDLEYDDVWMVLPLFSATLLESHGGTPQDLVTVDQEQVGL